MIGWRDVSFGDVLTLQRGFDITARKQQPGPYPVYSSSGAQTTHSEYIVDGPGVIVGRKGSLGTVFFSPGPYWPHDTTLWVKDFHGNDPRFAYYFVQTLELQRYDAGASNPTLNRNHVHALRIRWPDNALQRRIARTLAAYDELIENNNRRVGILEEMARAVYREWFVEYRFPNSKNQSLIDSELGRIPARWTVRCVNEIADVNRTQIDLRDPPEEIGYIDIASVSPGRIDQINSFRFEDAPGRARRIVSHGDILWSCVRPNRRSHVLVLNPDPNTIASTGFAVLTATAVPFTFLYQGTTTDEFVGYLTNHATGAAYPAVTADTFKRAKLVIPTQDLLKKFAAIADPIAAQVAVLLKQNENLRRTRDLLLPRLMSGKLRI